MTALAQRVRLHASETIEPPHWAVRELEFMERIEDGPPKNSSRATPATMAR